MVLRERRRFYFHLGTALCSLGNALTRLVIVGCGVAVIWYVLTAPEHRDDVNLGRSARNPALLEPTGCRSDGQNTILVYEGEVPSCPFVIVTVAYGVEMNLERVCFRSRDGRVIGSRRLHDKREQLIDFADIRSQATSVEVFAKCPAAKIPDQALTVIVY